MKLVRLGGTYEVAGNTLKKVNDETPDMRLYRIGNIEDKGHVKHYCIERVEENVRQYVSGMSAFETRIALDELIKKGALIAE